MTPPREPFFKPEDFSAEVQRPYALHGTAAGPIVSKSIAEIASRLVEPLLKELEERRQIGPLTGKAIRQLEEENERLTQKVQALAQLLAPAGQGDAVRVIDEIVYENERLRAELNTAAFERDHAKRDYFRECAESNKLRNEIEQAPVVYGQFTESDGWYFAERRSAIDTHKARLVRIVAIAPKEIKK